MGTISTRYAKAAYQYAEGKGEEHALYCEMKLLTDNFSSFQSLNAVLENPVVSAEDKIKVLVTAAGIEVSESYRNLLNLIVKNKRETYMLQIALMYLEYYKKQQGVIVCRLTTATPASEKTKKDLESLIKSGSHKKVDFIDAVQPDIIGGFILKLEDLQLDASVRSQLNHLRIQLEK